MKQYWEAIDGEKFENRWDCEEYEVGLIKRDYGIEFFDYDGDVTDDFSEAYKVTIYAPISGDDWELLNDWYGSEVPKEAGVHIWDECKNCYFMRE